MPNLQAYSKVMSDALKRFVLIAKGSRGAACKHAVTQVSGCFSIFLTESIVCTLWMECHCSFRPRKRKHRQPMYGRALHPGCTVRFSPRALSREKSMRNESSTSGLFNLYLSILLAFFHTNLYGPNVQALDSPDVHVFGELLSLPSVKAVSAAYPIIATHFNNQHSSSFLSFFFPSVVIRSLSNCAVSDGVLTSTAFTKCLPFL